MSASTNDHQKLDRMMDNLDRQIGPASSEDKEKMHNVLDMCQKFMQDEDPNELIYCNDGHLHRSADVNVWGSCPDMM